MLTWGFVLHANAVPADEALGAVAVEGALLVDASLVEARARYLTFLTFVDV